MASTLHVLIMNVGLLLLFINTKIIQPQKYVLYFMRLNNF